MQPKLSIIIPVYNEEKRIPRTIGSIFEYLKTYSLKTEVIFVDDGSKDATIEVLKRFQAQYTFCIVSYAPNHGKGYAVRQGVFAAKGEWVAFFDIDLATPLSALEDLQQRIEIGTDAVVISSRRIGGAQIVKSESGTRSFLGRGYTLLSRIFVPEVKDFTCGFKAYRSDAAKKIFAVAKIDRWAFDTEILFLAKRFGYTIYQIPVLWTHDEASRVRVLRDVVRSARELLAIFYYASTGQY